MDAELTNKFTRKFGDVGDHAMPNEDAKMIRTLIEDGDYRQALDRLIDYFGENSVQTLNWRIHELKGEIKSLEADNRDLERSNNAEHSEKVKYMDMAENGMDIIRDMLKLVVNQPAGSQEEAELLSRAQNFVDRCRREGIQ